MCPEMARSRFVLRLLFKPLAFNITGIFDVSFKFYGSRGLAQRSEFQACYFSFNRP